MPVPESFIHKLPKIEHHLHIEGTLEPELLFKLANRNNITLPTNFPKTPKELKKIYLKDFNNLQDFLDYYYIGTTVLIKEQDFYDLTLQYFETAKKDNLVHAEIFFDPQSHLKDNRVDLLSVINGIKKACAFALKNFNITSNLIMCILRHESPEEAISLINQSKKYLSDGTITGLGLDSSEKPFPPELFEDAYKLAKSFNKHLKFTAHAGEEGPADYITKSLDTLNVTRIDHGVNAKDSPELMQRLCKEKILLTVCPLSNINLKVIKDVSELPLTTFLAYGIPFSINSDDPAYFGGYIQDNYMAVYKAFPNWGLFTWGQIVKNAIAYSWCDDERKKELTNEVDALITSFVNGTEGAVEEFLESLKNQQKK